MELADIESHSLCLVRRTVGSQDQPLPNDTWPPSSKDRIQGNNTYNVKGNNFDGTSALLYCFRYFLDVVAARGREHNTGVCEGLCFTNSCDPSTVRKS